jgi:hypothetical protein
MPYGAAWTDDKDSEHVPDMPPRPNKGTQMPIDAIFALASMTKPMAAMAGLTLMRASR